MKKEEIASKRFLILGAARSGIAAVRLLQRQGGSVALADSKNENELGDLRQEIAALGVSCYWGNDHVENSLSDFHILVKSPGIPQTNPIIVKARSLGLRVISEIELASAFVQEGVRIIAITGTNGKTTTTAWIGHMLTEGGYEAILGGNIGQAWANTADRHFAHPEKSFFVIETSSFQLEDLEDFCPHVALLTNLSADHMDRYDDSMEKYVAAKFNILKNMAGCSVLVYNGGDEESRKFAERFFGDKVSFSSRADSGGENIAFVSGKGMITVRHDGQFVPLVQTESLPLPGKHNLENALSGILACVSAGVNPQELLKGLQNFGGVEHRIEFCGKRPDGVCFYNDSKATNLDAMKQAVAAFDKPIVLIAGGRDAHSDYASINELIREKVKYLVTLGEAAELIETAWRGLVPGVRAADMRDAVIKADQAAETGDVIVYSPACKSFDMYKNFEERGDDFKKWVKSMVNK